MRQGWKGPVFSIPPLERGAMGKSDESSVIIRIVKHPDTPLTPLKRGSTMVIFDRYT